MRRGDERGFALLVVVFLLFAVGVSAATAYHVVYQENRLSLYSGDGERARILAEAGLRRYVGEVLRGPVADTLFAFDLGDGRFGESRVRARQIHRTTNWRSIYQLEAGGSVPDPRHFETPATRGATRVVEFRAPPVNVFANLVGTGSVTLSGSATAPAGDAYVGSAEGCDLLTAPWAPANWREQNVSLAALGLPDWSDLISPSFPTDAVSAGGYLNFLPATGVDYPVIRVTGATFQAGSFWQGEGVLIVQGNMNLRAGFIWNGLILVGGTLSSPAPGFLDFGPPDPPVVNGMIVAGLASPPRSFSLNRGTYRFHSCHLRRAGVSMGVFNEEEEASFAGY